MASDMFLQIEGIEGESTDENHGKWIEIMSYSHGVSQPASANPSDAGGRTSGRCTHAEFSISKYLDQASPKLTLKCSDGSHIPKITVELCRSSGNKEPYMQYVLEDVIISNVSVGGSPGDLPVENVSFNYGKINWTYTGTDHKTGKPGGKVPTFWDLKTNKGG